MRVMVVSPDDAGAGMTTWLNVRGIEARLKSRFCPGAVPEWKEEHGEPDLVWPPGWRITSKRRRWPS